MLQHGEPLPASGPAGGPAREASVVEILPLALDRSGLILLRPRRLRSWVVDWRPSTPPRQLVLDRLTEAGLRPCVVHSTSWRHDQGRLVLTHLAVLTGHTRDTGELEAVAVRRCPLARSSATHPPAVIQVEQVVEHALRHLAWLAHEDAVVRRCLGERWSLALRTYALEPFRAMEFEPPLAGTGW
jgi:hypothetical protein